jgi:LuxR family maltose regulon positive regulatory protein
MSATAFRQHRPVLALRPSQARPADEEQMPSALETVRIAYDGQSPTVALSPALEDSASAMALRGWLVQSLLLEAIVRDAAGDAGAAASALERALDLAEHDRVLLPFLVPPVVELLGRHAREGTAHADLIAEIVKLVPAAEALRAESLREPLTESEIRVLRHLPTNLSKREIADELYVSLNTVKTHVKHLYAKLDVRTRRQAVERARELGLLSHRSRTAPAPSLAFAA